MPKDISPLQRLAAVGVGSGIAGVVTGPSHAMATVIYARHSEWRKYMRLRSIVASSLLRGVTIGSTFFSLQVCKELWSASQGTRQS
ncbi:MAG: hypothetical protein AAGI90_05385 [Chlamydiota bacterium]